MSQDRFDFERNIFNAVNQDQLESAMFGQPLVDRSLRESYKQAAMEQIAQYKGRNDGVGYTAMAYVQLAALQMGLGEDWFDSANSALSGLEESLAGDESDIMNMGMIVGSILGYWTNKADANSKFRIIPLLRYTNRIITDNFDHSNKSMHKALAVPAAWLTIMMLVWTYAIEKEVGSGLPKHLPIYESGTRAAAAIGRLTSKELDVSGWVQRQVEEQD